MLRFFWDERGEVEPFRCAFVDESEISKLKRYSEEIIDG